MTLRFALLGVVLACSAATSRATDFPWPGRGVIRFDVPDGWKIHGQPVEDYGYAFRASPDSGAPALVQLTVIRLPADKPVPAAELPDRLHESLRPYIEQSVEKEFLPVRLRCRQGHGWYAELTDSNLVGKPHVENDFKVMRNALIALDDHTMAIATMQFDDPDGAEAGEMLALVSSLRLESRADAQTTRLFTSKLRRIAAMTLTVGASGG